MDPKFAATHAALDHFDSVDQRAVNAARRSDGVSLNMSGYVDARKLAADHVRAAYLADMDEMTTWEIVELMSVDRIRRAMDGTPLGRMLGLLS